MQQQQVTSSSPCYSWCIMTAVLLQFLKTEPLLKKNEPNAHDFYQCSEFKKAWAGAPEGKFDPLGCLDFYSPHSYPIWTDHDATAMHIPFYHNKSTWGVNKPVLLGEFWDMKNIERKSPYAPADYLQGEDFVDMFQRGYAGGLGWAWFTPKEVRDAKGYAVSMLDKHELRDQWKRIMKSASSKLKAKGVNV